MGEAVKGFTDIFRQVDTFFVIFSTWHGFFFCFFRRLIWKSTMKGLETENT